MIILYITQRGGKGEIIERILLLRFILWRNGQINGSDPIRSDPICITNLYYDLYYDLYYWRNLGMDRIQSIPYILYLPQHQQQQQQQQQATISVRTLSIH